MSQKSRQDLRNVAIVAHVDQLGLGDETLIVFYSDNGTHLKVTTQTKDGPVIWEDHFYPEIIDPKSGRVLPDGDRDSYKLSDIADYGPGEGNFWSIESLEVFVRDMIAKADQETQADGSVDLGDYDDSNPFAYVIFAHAGATARGIDVAVTELGHLRFRRATARLLEVELREADHDHRVARDVL